MSERNIVDVICRQRDLKPTETLNDEEKEFLHQVFNACCELDPYDLAKKEQKKELQTGLEKLLRVPSIVKTEVFRKDLVDALFKLKYSPDFDIYLDMERVIFDWMIIGAYYFKNPPKVCQKEAPVPAFT